MLINELGRANIPETFLLADAICMSKILDVQVWYLLTK